MILIFLVLFSLVFADDTSAQLKVGMRAPEWVFQDSDGNNFTMDFLGEKIIKIDYIDPDVYDMNEPFNDELKKLVVVDSLIYRNKFDGFGIVDCKSSWIPDFLIRKIAAEKAKKFDSTVLFDYDAKLQKLWGLKKNSYNVIILDKNRVCRAMVRGEITEEKQKELVQLILDLQNKM